MATTIWGWDTPNTKWVKVLVDSLGHLQADVLSSALPTGAATLAKQTDQLTKLNTIITKLAGGLPAALDTLALKVKEQSPITGFATSAKQDTIIGHVDGVEGLLAGGLPAALDTLALKVREQGTPSVHLYGYDGAAWQTLLTESDALKNLRVKLYDGASGIFSQAVGTTNLPNASIGLIVGAVVRLAYGLAGGYYSWWSAASSADNMSGANFPCVGLMGFDGTTWDRLRSFGTGILSVADYFTGGVYSKTMTMADDLATRFETTAKKLRDVVIIVKTNPMLLGETGVEVYPVGADETIGFTKVDISTLYFKNAGAGLNGVISILGVEE